ncbi:hypothetical protein XNC1_1111 [Xenorhabdus nematophila ATCC 19061]|uniref:Uncharacterized protein n=1 Tax=Xenorhabdus nematophila (strain ATCC 19061 / DSM 3370 / CCUG 14189 / LMG 1036 / NCIMB 9965 / AN6) TaxID=406817 RepID=D3V8Y4_XENNA|nr:hypothetical protein XNC1_1111 [Xenorhabdus nematophila ATCC 19061]CEE94080.1 hypothetical protein XNA1_450023 [Xenorhabdus nematophila str. Anatoliense]CEE94661.1 hypothetical protein XNA1_4780022 [Xenorhabdus nematophila str. Anatoliense]CEK22088.1 hypothetical protein XNC2_1092 [Xenorhabdus nematophila AN6/1]
MRSMGFVFRVFQGSSIVAAIMFNLVKNPLKRGHLQGVIFSYLHSKQYILYHNDERLV